MFWIKIHPNLDRYLEKLMEHDEALRAMLEMEESAEELVTVINEFLEENQVLPMDDFLRSYRLLQIGTFIKILDMVLNDLNLIEGQVLEYHDIWRRIHDLILTTKNTLQSLD